MIYSGTIVIPPVYPSDAYNEHEYKFETTPAAAIETTRVAGLKATPAGHPVREYVMASPSISVKAGTVYELATVLYQS